MHDVDAGEMFQQLAGHVIVRARTGRAVIERARFRSRQREQLGQVLRRHGRVHHQHQVAVDQRRDRNQIAHQLIRFLVVQRFVDGLRAGDHQQRVAVGRSLGDQVGADGGSGARAVVHDEGLVQGLAQFLGDGAGVDVGRPAGAKRDDDSDRTAMGSHRPCRWCPDSDSGRQSEKGCEMSHKCHARFPGLCASSRRPRQLSRAACGPVNRVARRVRPRRRACSCMPSNVVLPPFVHCAKPQPRPSLRLFQTRQGLFCARRRRRYGPPKSPGRT